MSSRRNPPEVPAAVPGHVREVIHHLLRPEELDSWTVRWVRHDGAWLLVCDLVACGEPFFGSICGAAHPRRLRDGLDMFTDSLEDFISESRFAWGQQREMHDRPWRRA